MTSLMGIALYVPELKEIQLPHGDPVPVPEDLSKVGLARLRAWARENHVISEDTDLGQFS